MNDITMMILKIVVAVAVTLITGFLIPLLKNLINNIKDQNLKNAVEAAVQAAEQTIKGSGTGAAKKEDVLKSMIEWCAQHGINLTDKQLDQLIESAVFAMNNTKTSS